MECIWHPHGTSSSCSGRGLIAIARYHIHIRIGARSGITGHFCWFGIATRYWHQPCCAAPAYFLCARSCQPTGDFVAGGQSHASGQGSAGGHGITGQEWCASDGDRTCVSPGRTGRGLRGTCDYLGDAVEISIGIGVIEQITAHFYEPIWHPCWPHCRGILDHAWLGHLRGWRDSFAFGQGWWCGHWRCDRSWGRDRGGGGGAFSGRYAGWGCH